MYYIVEANKSFIIFRLHHFTSFTISIQLHHSSIQSRIGRVVQRFTFVDTFNVEHWLIFYGYCHLLRFVNEDCLEKGHDLLQRDSTV